MKRKIRWIGFLKNSPWIGFEPPEDCIGGSDRKREREREKSDNFLSENGTDYSEFIRLKRFRFHESVSKMKLKAVFNLYCRIYYKYFFYFFDKKIFLLLVKSSC